MIIREAKELSRGVFWVIDDEILAYPFFDGEDRGVAKSGVTYNHKRLWPLIKPKKCNVDFDYYPRGRVDIDNKGRAIIYMNPNIDDSMIGEIKREFGIVGDCKIFYDNSKHYQCYLDW